jgi:glycosyltransferase involved in cell wall biosynthesis
VDALSVSYGRRVAIESPWRRPALAFEVRRLARYEERLLRSEARCLVVSEADRRLLGSAGGRASVNPNGVDLAAFPFMPDQGTSGRIVFVGNLGYSPNSDAALWFATEVLPGVRTRVPESELVIVGPRAPRRVLNLAARPGVVVAGIVPDVHDALIAARVAIAPLRAGAGIQNKVLEAMAAGVPVVGTSLAVGGIDVVPGTHCLVADDPAGFAEAVASLLTQAELRHRIASAARDLVVARYTWERSVADLETIYREVVHAGITPRAAARGGADVERRAGTDRGTKQA